MVQFMFQNRLTKGDRGRREQREGEGEGARPANVFADQGAPIATARNATTSFDRMCSAGSPYVGPVAVKEMVL